MEVKFILAIVVVVSFIVVVVEDNAVVVICNDVVVSFVVVVKDDGVVVIGGVVVSSFVSVVVDGNVVVFGNVVVVSIPVVVSTAVVPLTQFVDDVSWFALVHVLYIVSCEHSGIHSQDVSAICKTQNAELINARTTVILVPCFYM